MSRDDPRAYAIEFASGAAKEFLKLPASTQRRLQPKIDALQSDLRPHGCEKLSGLDAYRIRVGDYRIVYEVHDGLGIVTIAAIGHRRDVYRRG